MRLEIGTLVALALQNTGKEGVFLSQVFSEFEILDLAPVKLDYQSLLMILDLVCIADQIVAGFGHGLDILFQDGLHIDTESGVGDRDNIQERDSLHDQVGLLMVCGSQASDRHGDVFVNSWFFVFRVHFGQNTAPE